MPGRFRLERVLQRNDHPGVSREAVAPNRFGRYVERGSPDQHRFELALEADSAGFGAIRGQVERPRPARPLNRGTAPAG
jgi:hypothetical protein